MRSIGVVTKGFFNPLNFKSSTIKRFVGFSKSKTIGLLRFGKKKS
jgi:hypothetical protein